jgi:uncharacterized protein (DUF736 family)
MARIGTFKATPEGFTGSIHTLRLHVRKVDFKSIEGDPAKSQPVYRVFAEGAEIGAAWKHTSKKGVEFLSVNLDDPSFPAPVNARLYAAEEGFDLVWTRPARKRDAEADVAAEAEGQPEPES